MPALAVVNSSGKYSHIRIWLRGHTRYKQSSETKKCSQVCHILRKRLSYVTLPQVLCAPTAHTPDTPVFGQLVATCPASYICDGSYTKHTLTSVQWKTKERMVLTRERAIYSCSSTPSTTPKTAAQKATRAVPPCATAMRDFWWEVLDIFVLGN
jgi:hypothetical protein